MSVDAQEMCFIREVDGTVRATAIGAFIDDCLETGVDVSRFDVLCFDQHTHCAEFKPIRSVIRHGVEEPLYEVRTAYGRSVRVTASHSVFVFENDQVVLKRGDAIRPGDQVVAPARLPLWREILPPISICSASCTSIEIVSRVTSSCGVRGSSSCSRSECVAAMLEMATGMNRGWQFHRQWVPPWRSGAALGLRQSDVCEAVGIKQPVTFYGWEKGVNRPTLGHFRRYVDLLDLDAQELLTQVTVGPSKLDQTWETQYAGSGRNQVKPWLRFSSMTGAEIERLNGVRIATEHYAGQSISRHLPVTESLLFLLGFFTAEGTVTQRGGVRWPSADATSGSSPVARGVRGDIWL